MNLAFSTLALPGASAADVVAAATAHGFTTVELRAAEGEWLHVDADAEQLDLASAMLHAAGLRVLSVASYVRLADLHATDSEVVAAASAHALLAQRLGAPYVRVFPGSPMAPDRDVDARAGARLAMAVEAVADLGVGLAVETHDGHGRGADVRRLLDQPGCSEATAVWDALHTWRGGEDPDATMDALDGRLAYVQVKDVTARDDLRPLTPGLGVLPLAHVAAVLRARFDGWVSWEYERPWYPDSRPFEEVAGDAMAWMRRELAPVS